MKSFPKKITARWLAKMGACVSGRIAFSNEWPDGMELTPANVARCLASDDISWNGVKWAYDKWAYDNRGAKDKGYERYFWALLGEAKNAIVAVEVRKRGKGEFDAMECDCTNCLAKAIPRFYVRLHVRLARLIFRELSPPKKKAKV